MKPKSIQKKWMKLIQDSLFAKSFRLAKQYKNNIKITVLLTIIFAISFLVLQLLAQYSTKNPLVPWLLFPIPILIVFLLIYYYKIGLMVLFDILFIASFLGMQILFKYLAQSLALPTTVASAVTFIVFSLIYYMAILLAYSFFKYCIMDFIKSLFEKEDFSFKMLGEFYLLNLIIAGIFFAIMLPANFLLASIKQAYAPYVFIFLAAPYLLFLYVILNTSHSLFYQGASAKESLKKSLGMTFGKMRVYRETILAMIVLVLALWILLFGGGYLISILASKNYSLYLSIYSYFKQVSVIVFDAAFYFIILINRISFYAITKEENKG